MDNVPILKWFSSLRPDMACYIEQFDSKVIARAVAVHLVAYGKILINKGQCCFSYNIYDWNDVRAFTKAYQRIKQINSTHSRNPKAIMDIARYLSISQIATYLHTTKDAIIEILRELPDIPVSCFEKHTIPINIVKNIIEVFNNRKPIDGSLKAAFDCPLLCHLYNLKHPFQIHEIKDRAKYFK
jgi:hypothetical protein